MARKYYSKEEKASYIEAFKQSGLNFREFSKENNIPETTIRDWINNKKNIRFGELKLKENEILKSVNTSNVFENETIKIVWKEGCDKKLILRMIEVIVSC